MTVSTQFNLKVFAYSSVQKYPELFIEMKKKKGNSSKGNEGIL